MRVAMLGITASWALGGLGEVRGGVMWGTLVGIGEESEGVGLSFGFWSDGKERERERSFCIRAF